MGTGSPSAGRGVDGGVELLMETITATYIQENDDWTVTVAGLGKELTGRAPGIIAARDRADQLVEKIAADGKAPTVVHLLGGSALEFTAMYMTARLSRPSAGSRDQGERQPEETAKTAKARNDDAARKGRAAARGKPATAAGSKKASATSKPTPAVSKKLAKAPAKPADAAPSKTEAPESTETRAAESAGAAG